MPLPDPIDPKTTKKRRGRKRKKKLSEEHRRNMTIAHRLRCADEQVREQIMKNLRVGPFKHTAESRAKMSKNQLGRPSSPKQRAAARATLKARNAYKAAIRLEFYL